MEAAGEDSSPMMKTIPQKIRLEMAILGSGKTKREMTKRINHPHHPTR